MHKYALIAIFCLACIVGCKDQNHAVEDPETPVFSLSGLANTIPLRLDAGVNNYYLYTTFSKEANNVYVFGGQLRPKDCAACGPSLAISFRNYTTSTSFPIDSAIVVGDYPYYDTRNPVETYYRLWCYSSAAGIGPAAISWNFGNNRFSSEPNPIVTFPLSGIYPITCSAVFPGGCFSELVQPIFLTPTRVGKTIDFSVNYPDTYTVLFNSIPVDPNARVSWDFGDGQTALGTIAKHTFATGAMYKVCMEYIKGTDTMQLCKNVNTLDITKCKNNFTYRSELIIDSLHLSHVVVEWKDENGIMYSSGLATQNVSNTFKVLSVKEYLPNEQGQKTRMITVQFSCSVSNGTNTIALNNITGTFAVAYP
jgi:hypothetical protein